MIDRIMYGYIFMSNKSCLYSVDHRTRIINDKHIETII